MTPVPDETQVAGLIKMTNPVVSFERSQKQAAKALETKPARKPLGLLARGAVIALTFAHTPGDHSKMLRAIAPELTRETCAACGSKIPPGKAGRKCKDCRRAEP